MGREVAVERILRQQDVSRFRLAKRMRWSLQARVSRLPKVSSSLALSALSSVFDLNDSGVSTAPIGCQGGSATATLIDNDSNGLINSGDDVRIDYSSCLQGSLGSPATGTMLIDIVDVRFTSSQSSIGELRISIPTPIELVVGDTVVFVSGSFGISHIGTETLERLHVFSDPSDELTVRITDGSNDAIEIVDDFSISRTIDAAGLYAVQFSLSVDSEISGGTFACASLTNLIADVLLFPNVGTVECTGRQNSSVRVVSSGVGNIATQVDEEGDGNFVDAGTVLNGTGTWADYLEGQLVAGRVDPPRVLRERAIPTIASDSISIAVRDIEYSALTGQLYVINDLAVVEVDPATLVVDRSIALGDIPSVTAISDDGSTLWVGFRDVGEIVSVDISTMTLGPRLSLGVSMGSMDPRLAEDIEVAPGTTDTVVVATQTPRSMLGFSVGGQLPNIVTDRSLPSDFEFEDATTMVGIQDGGTPFNATVIDLDANGLSLRKVLRSFAFNANAQLALFDGRGYISSGRVFDAFNEVIVGLIDLDQNTVSRARNGIFLDDQARVAYFWQNSGGIIDFYDADRLTSLGAYRMLASGNLIPAAGWRSRPTSVCVSWRAARC